MLPLLRTLQESLEVMSICIDAVKKADLGKPPVPISDRMALTFAGDTRSDDQKKASYLNWLLSKGFQEYARGIRAALEEASYYNETVIYLNNLTGGSFDWADFTETLRQVRVRAQRLGFPDLMAEVNRGLSEPVAFRGELSLTSKSAKLLRAS